MLPDPTLTFTLPSVHDDTVLDCRVFHPYSLSPSPSAPPWKRHAAIVAHPYAPMGGCYDDPVVDTIGEALLRAGFLVATFNFRGASKSAGKTSWTGRPEQGDYMSLVGFMVYYVHYLDPYGLVNRGATGIVSHDDAETPIFLSAGYSYGALITSRLPPLDHILSQFAGPVETSAAGEIRLRAQHLAEQQNSWLSQARASRTLAPATPRSMRVGGDEGEQRRSSDMRRSQSPHTEDKLRRGVSELLARTRHRRSSSHRRSKSGLHRHEEVRPAAQKAEQPAVQLQHLEPVPDLVKVRPAYLLVSAPQGAYNHLLTLSFFQNPGSTIFSRPKPQGNEGEAAAEGAAEGAASEEVVVTDHEAAEAKLARNTTLAVYGDRDVFGSASKNRAWARRLQDVEGSQFRAVEVHGAGHFYIEGRTLYVLQEAVTAFASGLLGHADGAK